MNDIDDQSDRAHDLLEQGVGAFGLLDQRRRRMERLQWAAIFTLTCLVGVLLFFNGKRTEDARDTADSNRAYLKGEAGIPGVPGRNGIDGAPGPGPTDDQIASAVDSYCARFTCRGEQGSPGQDGSDGNDGRNGRDARAPTRDQLEDAVRAYCAPSRCRGTQGPRGPKGDTPSGADVARAVNLYCSLTGNCRGPTGARGPGPTDAQVQAAVEEYCARSGCPPVPPAAPAPEPTPPAVP